MKSWIAAAFLCAAVLGPARAWTATRRTVCTISFNGSDEVDVFRAFLPPDEFEFVDLAPDAAPGGNSGRTWLLDACRRDVHTPPPPSPGRRARTVGCRRTVVIYSGEFAMCEITKRVDLGTEFGSDDFSSGVFGLAEGVRLVDCLHPVDARVNVRLAAALDAADPSLRLWAAYALSRRLPLDARTLTLLAGYLNDTLPDLRERVRWSFRAQKALPDGVVDAVRVQDPALARELRPDDARRSPWG